MRGPEREQAAGATPLERITGLGLALSLALTLGAMLFPGLVPRPVAGAVYLFVLPLLVPRLGRQHLVFLAACLAFAVALAVKGDFAALGRAVWQSATLAALVTALVLLRMAAIHSSGLTRLARDVAAMPRGSRDIALSLAGQFIGLLLNVGVFGLLAPLISQSGAPAAEQRRMALAVLRGFGPTMVWAPTAAAQAIITTMVPGITWASHAPGGFTMAMALIAFSWAYGAVERRLFPGPPPRVRQSAFDRRALGEVMAVVGTMFVLIVALHALAGLHLLAAVMVASIVIFLGWSAAGARGMREAPGARTLALARRTLGVGFAKAAPEIMTLGAAGFMAAAISPLIPEAWLDAVMVPLAARPMLLYPAIALTMVALSTAGLNSLVAASLIGGTFVAIPPAFVEPGLLAFSLAAGWGVAYGASPFTTGTVVLATALHTTPTALAWRWNGPFTLLATIFVLLVVLAVAWLS